MTFRASTVSDPAMCGQACRRRRAARSSTNETQHEHAHSHKLAYECWRVACCVFVHATLCRSVLDLHVQGLHTQASCRSCHQTAYKLNQLQNCRLIAHDPEPDGV